MRSFLKKAELSVVKSRLEDLKRRSEQQRRISEDASLQSKKLDEQLADEIKQIDANCVNYQQKKEEVDKLKLKGILLEQECNELETKLESADSRKASDEAEIQSLKDTIADLKSQSLQIDGQVSELNLIIYSSPPQPKYNSTPATCVNGHVNCKNLPCNIPGKTTCINQQEIDDHKKQVEEAQAEKIALLNQQSQILEQLNQLGIKYSNLELDCATAQTDYWTYENLLANKKQALETNKTLIEEAEAEYESLSEENAKSEHEKQAKLLAEKAAAEKTAGNANAQVATLEAEMQRLEDQARALELEIQRIDADERLEALARRELALERLARQETQRESQQSVGSVAKKVVDELKNVASDVVETVRDVYPGPGGLMAEAMKKRIYKDFLGNPITHSHDLLINQTIQQDQDQQQAQY